MKEVQNLKKNVIELEEDIKKLRSDLKIVCERNTDVEDRLMRERNLRKRVGKNLMQLQEEHSKSDGSSSSSDDSSNDGCCSDDEIQSKAKGKSSKHNQGQGEGSKKNTASKKTHQNQSNLFRQRVCN